MHNRYRDSSPYTTKDGSIVRELVHPQTHGNHNQSLAEAIVPPDTATLLHRHYQSEELYHITSGEGVMILGDERFSVSVGDTVLIPAGTAHAIENNGDTELTLLCCCAPAYSHEDTELL